jgi:hypothetical protein
LNAVISLATEDVNASDRCTTNNAGQEVSSVNINRMHAVFKKMTSLLRGEYLIDIWKHLFMCILSINKLQNVGIKQAVEVRVSRLTWLTWKHSLSHC